MNRIICLLFGHKWDWSSADRAKDIKCKQCGTKTEDAVYLTNNGTYEGI